ncbi:right-handed parallel beta-helix repeat-containing protein [Candidatus Binatia bacterium]|nr:right-handed parallel beta-helix repeat-containing protein [Candidatus Binatia bacterium]
MTSRGSGEGSVIVRGARIVAVALAVLLSGGVATMHAAANPTTNPVYVCSGKITTALRSYTEDALHVVAGCRAKLLRTPGDGCLGNLATELANLERDFEKQVSGCPADATRALCALEAKTTPLLRDAVTVGERGLRAQLTALVDDLLVVPQADSCPRPSRPVGGGVKECADRIVQQIEQTAEELEQCAFSCERANLIAPDREPCVDDITGDPIDGGVAECVARKTAELAAIAGRCDADGLRALGCPLGATTVGDLVARLGERIVAITRELNRGVFHARCQGALPGQPTSPSPAPVTLEPSQTKRTISCGTVIDDAFLGRDRRIVFDGDLDCGPSQTATDGLVVARSGVTIDGRSRAYAIRGPRRSSLRTGAGIRLAPGVKRVRIVDFKSIESFAVGIEDAAEGDNRKLTVEKTTVRRNVQAGIRVRSRRATIARVTADKNGIGFDVSGDGSAVKRSVAKGSLYEPKVGIRLGGTDPNLDGIVVTVRNTTVEGNAGVGIEIVEGSQRVLQSSVQTSGGDGIVLREGARGSLVDSCIVKLNARGILVLGDANVVASNTCEENLGAGFVVAGRDNVVEQNKSGKKTARGNAGAGFEVTGEGGRLYANQAEANGGAGFVVEATTALFKGNSSQANAGAGFALLSAGNVVESCAAETNAGAEWDVAAGNIDRRGNKANGSTITLPADGGTCEGRGGCTAGR